MALQKDQSGSGSLTGIPVPPNKSLLHQLFADDMGLFLQSSQQSFKVAQQMIHSYEQILGACPNLEKSIIVQLDTLPTPHWFQTIG